MTDMTLADLLSAEFVDGEVRQFTGRGGQTFDYIEDETVMDRLDEVLGIGNWEIGVEPIGVSDGIVKVTLTVRFPFPEDMGGPVLARYEDFGYASNPSGEGLKEAVSDGIRRCGRYLGIGRYLYRKHASPNGRVPSPPARPAPRPVPVSPSGAGPVEPPEISAMYGGADRPLDKRDGFYGPQCPVHKRTWHAEYNKCTAKDPDGKNGYCEWRPSKKWQAEHEL